MKLLFFLFISFKAFSFQAVITALEAPLFKVQDSQSRVIQYFRKGDIITIHRADRFGIFFKTLTKTSDEAYILKEHVHVYYDDARELDQIKESFDNTDYRIPEPIPKKYPLIRETGYRGQFFLSLGSFNPESYNYSQPIQDSTSDSNVSYSFLWSKGLDTDLSRRLFRGLLGNISNSESTYLFSDSKSTEKILKIGIGPYISYDVWKNDKYILTLHSSILINLYDNLKISIEEDEDISSVDYTAYSFESRSGIQFSIQNVLADLDFICGFGANFTLPKEYKLNENNTDKSFESSYSTSINSQLSISLGIQSNY